MTTIPLLFEPFLAQTCLDLDVGLYLENDLGKFYCKLNDQKGEFHKSGVFDYNEATNNLPKLLNFENSS